ncbi:MarR family transcriptional regulator [Kitasatospora sp. NBC_00240]|uniref:MarR family winged helix-turn-helix transcriptional regulator n=1 Tax=Kitasatospora sp. NBC_00240 TaxID=2903567 RepID=UPI0022595BDB|nr:MarR family transcriptional regulator [Kitasatospora sp. NBC_00240]MCX5211964.1 MarR family transcriptional regulator [Kitasatospora sp. NBC_00240]
MEPQRQMKPVGYWLNRTDAALTRYVDGMLAADGLSRLGWQVLNVIEDDPEATDTSVLTVLAANGEAAVLAATVESLVTGGWAARPAPGRLALTDDGRTRFARAAVRAGAFRKEATAGVTDEEYRIAVTVLERIARNAEAAADAAGYAGPGR